MKQAYSNHRKFYVPHHFVFLPLMMFLTVLGFVNMYRDQANKLNWMLFGILSFCILYLAIMLRQHYALGNQNRIVRLEFRLRYYQVFGQSADNAESRLTFSQIAALRFCDNAEFKILLQEALQENISGDEIKRAINNWQADDMRV